MAAIRGVVGVEGDRASAAVARPRDDGSSVVVMRAAGGSMQPVIRSGDWLFVSTPAPTLRAGDVVVIDREGEVVVHRILSVRRRLELGDASRRPARFLAEQVVGQVVAFGRDGRTTDLDTRRARARGGYQVLRGYGLLAAKRAMARLGMARRAHHTGGTSE